MYPVETEYFPVIIIHILSEPKSPEMSFHQTSLDGVIHLGNVKNKSNLLTPQLKQIVIYVSKSIRSFDSDIIQVGGSILERTVGDKAD